MRINFIMSNTVYSRIFNDIIEYFKKYLTSEHELFITQYPLNNMDIYHYFRPNLESELLQNSVVTVHHDLEDTDTWFDASVFIEKYRQADKIICLNKRQQAILAKYENITNTIVIPHGANNEVLMPKKQFNLKDKIIIGIVSKRYGRRVKGEALLHELYKRLDVKKISFCFVGEGRSRDMYEARSLGFFAVAYETLPYKMYNQLYNYMDILLIPSLFEGGPANIPEALYTKTPVIGRKIAMIADMVKEGINGCFLTGDPDYDSNLLNDLANNKNNILVNLMNNIQNKHNDILTWKNVVQKHIKLYESIIQNEVAI